MSVVACASCGCGETRRAERSRAGVQCSDEDLIRLMVYVRSNVYGVLRFNAGREVWTGAQSIQELRYNNDTETRHIQWGGERALEQTELSHSCLTHDLLALSRSHDASAHATSSAPGSR